MSSWKFMDEVLYGALKKKKQLELYIDKEGLLGIKIEGKPAFNGIAWECFENELEGSKDIKLWNKYSLKSNDASADTIKQKRK